MTFNKSILSLILLGACLSPGISLKTDKTMIDQAKGKDVVEAVAYKIMKSGIFPDDHGLLQRMAFVETLFGEEPDTFTAKKNIWFMSSAGVDVTKNAILNPLYTKIKQQFGIEWSQIVFANLSKPLIAGIAVSLYLSLHQPVPLYLEDQAKYYKRFWDPEMTEQKR